MTVPSAHARQRRVCAAADGGDTLYTMRQDGSDVHRLPLDVAGSAISPTGRRTGSASSSHLTPGTPSRIWTARADGGDAKELFHCGDGCLGTDYPAWSPDGRSIAFTYAAAPESPAGPPSRTAIRVIDLRSHEVRTIVYSSFPRLVGLARWSPDARRLVIERDRFSSHGRETGCRIEIVRVRDGRSRPITPYSRFGFHPDWSAKGDRITFDTYDPRHGHLALVALGVDDPDPGRRDGDVVDVRAGARDAPVLQHKRAVVEVLGE